MGDSRASRNLSRTGNPADGIKGKIKPDYAPKKVAKKESKNLKKAGYRR